MRAVLLYGANDVRIDEVPDITAGRGEVLLKVAHNGICGSDLHIIHGMREIVEPIPLGHEFSGTIEEVGDGVSGLQVGDRVCVQPNYYCGHCPRCEEGLTHLCETGNFIGTGTHHGGLSERIAVSASMVHPLPDGMSLELGALVEPMAVAYHAVGQTPVEPGQAALVMGAGPIGIGTLLALRVLGVDDVTVAELSPVRRQVIADLGADVLDPAEVDVAAEMRRRTGGRGVAVAFESAGATPALQAAAGATAARGTVMVIAGHRKPAPFGISELIMSERRLTSTLGYQPDDFRAIIELMATGAYPTTGWVEHIPLDALVEEGIRPLEAGKKMKVLVDL